MLGVKKFLIYGTLPILATIMSGCNNNKELE